MKKERVVKPDGRYLLYYSFAASELVPPGSRPAPTRRAQPRKPARSRRPGRPAVAGRI